MPLRLLAAGMLSFGLAIAGVAEVNVVVTDGSGRFSEGWLQGVVVEKDGKTICTEPYAIGKYISCRDSVSVEGKVWRAPLKSVWIETSGILGAMVVVNADGAVVCESPKVDLNSRGPEDVISCSQG